MLEYAYVARTEGGAIERGNVLAAAPAEAQRMLAGRGRRLVSLQEAPTSSLLSQAARSFCWLRMPSLQRVDAALLLQQLAVMLGSGLELVPSLRELSVHSPNRRDRQVCGELAVAIERGDSLEAALAKAKAFPAVVMRLVRVGEETGELPTMLRRAADFLDARRQSKGKLVAALAYPSLVAAAACSVAGYLVVYAIPKLGTFLEAMGRELPAMTQSLLDLSEAVRRFGPAATAIAFLMVAAFAIAYGWKPGRYRIDRALLRVPLVGQLIQMAETRQLASSLALMLRSGVFLPEALQTTAVLHRNSYLADRVAKSPDRLAAGSDLSTALGGHGFASMLPSMIAVGERTGELPAALEHVATFYGSQLDARLQRLTRLIEPAIIAVVGGGVGYVYVAFFMALLGAGANFK